MRTLKVLLAAGILSSVNAAWLEAPVYIFDKDLHSSLGVSPVPSVAPLAAGLLFAHRLGLSQYHNLSQHYNLGDVDDSTLQLLNRFRGPDRSLFGDDENEERKGKLFLVVEGVDKPEQFFDGPQTPSFTISNPPSPSFNIELTTTLLIQDDHQRKNSKSCASFQTTQASLTLLSGGFNGIDDHGACVAVSSLQSDRQDVFTVYESESTMYSSGFHLLHDSTAIFHVSILGSVARDDGTQSQSYLNAMTQVKDTIKQLRSHPSNQQATIVLMPPASNHVKRTSNAYGSYAVPNNILKTRQGQAEEALSLTHIEAAYPPVMDKMGLHEHRASNDSAQRKAILPICHSTKKACIAATGNCSGHGTCYNKYNRTSSDSEDKGCWACGCSKKGTIRSNRTTHWGGPACSKEDISGPFFLLAGLTIALVAVITWGVGLMYSIGQEDLPSVIGAGVAGPTARK